MRRCFTIFLLILFSSVNSWAKTEKFGTWIELDFTKKFLKKFEFSVIPEIRLQDDFTVDEYIFEGKLSYEPWKFLGFATSYRYSTNVKKNGNEMSQYLVLDATGKTEFDRFDGSLRLRFTNDSDGGELQWEAFYLRPRVKLGYNIRNWKTDPYISYEIYYDLQHNEFYKNRFDIGVNRKIGKLHEVGVYYRLQDYFDDKNSVNILGLNYCLKF